MRCSGALILAIVLLLHGCGSADKAMSGQPAGGSDEASQSIQLAHEVRTHVRAAASETGIPDIDPALFDAIAAVPRHEFVPPQLRPFAYLDIPLPVSREQNIAQPFLIALMTQLVRVTKDDIVFETGTGAGYHAAILTHLAKQVYSVDVVAPLATAAGDKLRKLGYTGVEVQASDGYYGWPTKGPFDVIIVKEAVREIPAPLLNQLKPGGRLVAPVGPYDQPQMLKLVTKDSTGRIRQRDILPVHFSPLQGGERI
jgi:protein-L-isoaspartate(D-aspartate) O-methyltransferase